MSKKDLISMDGTVVEDLSNGKYRVELDNGHTIVAYIGGKIRLHNIKIIVGDTVTVEVSPYDVYNGRIVYRKK